MKKPSLLLTFLGLVGLGWTQTTAQTASVSDFRIAQQPADRTVTFDVTDPGVSTPLLWGLDLAWLSESNIRRGIAFMGNDKIDIIRSSFTPTAPLVDGELPAYELGRLTQRLNIIDLMGRPMNLSLNCDHPSVHDYFYGNAENWAQLIDVTARHHEERGHTIVTVAPFNEPDYTYTGQGTAEHFYNIAGVLKENPRFANTRISGGNTLNNDQALTWYNRLKDRLDEGNTHQLAGSFDTYAAFFTAVRANGHHATNDELHNVMEAMVGVEYGMQTGIWWGTADYARGQFVKASHGERLGYAEHRPNWSAASVYRSPEGKVQAFGGMSERQAATTSYRFFSKDRDVYFDGVGPLREYTLVMPGGTGYQKDQANAERVINITWGEDIQPVIDGRYVLVNRNSGRVMDTAGSSKDNAANIQQSTYTRAVSQRWDVNPVHDRIGGDFSYFTILSANSGRSLDVLNWSLENGGNIIQYGDGKDPGHNEQWFLEYAEDGWFYIGSRHSGKYLEVANSSKLNGANIHQWEKTGEENQHWRFLPIGAAVEFVAPGAPTELKATAQSHSVRLDWTGSPDSDVAGYIVFRAESAGGPYHTIARNVTTTSFVDNTVAVGDLYYYSVKAIDQSLNRSEYSNEVSVAATGEKGLVVNLPFDETTQDATVNLNNGSVYGEVSYVEGQMGSAVVLDGSKSFLQLSPTVAKGKEFTFATWIYWKGGDNLQRIFDFGNGEDECMYLTVRSESRQIRFVMKKDGVEERLNAPTISSLYVQNNWGHLAVTVSEAGVRIYLNGEMVSESTSFTLSPQDIDPVLNYIGRGQSANPLFNGYMDDLRIYDYALSASEIAVIAELPTGISEVGMSENDLAVWPVPADDVLNVSYEAEGVGSALLTVYNIEGRVMMSQTILGQTELNVSALPAGMYLLKVTSGDESVVRKFFIKH